MPSYFGELSAFFDHFRPCLTSSFLFISLLSRPGDACTHTYVCRFYYFFMMP
ncbi:hypothetical protein HanHA300_Chr15g0580971 [Helianthus annuus]|nr:hypothetical protein HanHA300_Chr15g0580971 [Helianthus annuus]KAJ0650086.1 hypothetical protein HanLR1_Chr15g0591621 [Helianthus annuus]